MLSSHLAWNFLEKVLKFILAPKFTATIAHSVFIVGGSTYFEVTMWMALAQVVQAVGCLHRDKTQWVVTLGTANLTAQFAK